NPRLMPSCGSSQLATKAPMMPITILPISPNPAPRTIRPASQPAMAPITSAAMIPMETAPVSKIRCWPHISTLILKQKPPRSRPVHRRRTLDVSRRAGNLSFMFLQFFTSLREAQVPVTLREYLTLMEALDADLAEQSVEHFYYLSRAALVKDE